MTKQSLDEHKLMAIFVHIMSLVCYLFSPLMANIIHCGAVCCGLMTYSGSPAPTQINWKITKAPYEPNRIQPTMG